MNENNTKLLSYSSGAEKSNVGLIELWVRMLAWLVSFLEGSRQESVFLPFPASGDCLSSWAHGPFPFLKPAMASQVLPMSQPSDTDFFCLFLPLLKTCVIHWTHPGKPG